MKRGEIAHQLSRGAFYLAVEKTAALVSGIAYFALLLRWLGPTKYGIITLALSFVGLATAGTGNIELYLERYAAEFDARGQLATLRRAQNLALGIKLVLGSLAGGVLLALTPMLARQFKTPELGQLLPVLVLMIVCDGFATTGRATLYGLQRFRWISVLALGFHLAKTVMVGLLWWMRLGLPALALGLTTLTVVQALLSTALPMWVLRNGRDEPPASDDPEAQPPRQLLRPMVAYCAPLLGARLAFVSGQNFGKIVLGKLFDTTQLGYFSFAFQTVDRFVDLASTMSAALLPSLTRLVARGERERLGFVFNQAFRLIQVGSAALAFFLFAFATEITHVIGSAMFLPAVPLLRVLALVPVARTAQQPLNMLFQAMRMPGSVFKFALVRLVFEFGCFFALVPTIGIIGAGYANLAGAIAAFLAAHFALKHVFAEGSQERTRATVLSVVALIPFLAAAAILDRSLPGPYDDLCKLGLVPLAILTALALGLLTRYDLEKLGSVPLRAAWMRGTRDWAVGIGDRVARAVVGGRSS